MEVRLAGLEDMEGVKALLKKYHRDTISDEDRPDGFVTTAITDEQLAALIEKENGVTIIAEPSEDGPDNVLGFCFAAPWDFWAAWPLFRHMMDIIPDYEFEGKKIVLDDTYQYGPMCVDRSIRGTGAFERLFFTSLDQFRDRFPVMLTFVNQINKRSENAHNNKANMETIALDEAYLDVTYSAGSFERAGEMAREIKARVRSELGLYGRSVTLKLTYSDMQSITRSRSVTAADNAGTIYTEASKLLEHVEHRPVRLVGAGIYNLSGDEGRQLTIDDYLEDPDAEGQSVIDGRLCELQERYGLDFAGHIEDICHGNVLHRTIEYMRKHYPGKA